MVMVLCTVPGTEKVLDKYDGDDGNDESDDDDGHSEDDGECEDDDNDSNNDGDNKGGSCNDLFDRCFYFCQEAFPDPVP